VLVATRDGATLDLPLTHKAARVLASDLRAAAGSDEPMGGPVRGDAPGAVDGGESA